MNYVIRWKNTLTGSNGNGKVENDRSVAESWAKRMNSLYPHILHWVETLPSAILQEDKHP